MAHDNGPDATKMADLDDLLASSAAGVNDLAFTGPTKMLLFYHQFVQPGTEVLEARLSVPSDVAPMLSICVGVFVPLYFLGSLLFSWMRFSGSIKWEMSSTVPSMLHGVVSTVVGFWLLSEHWSANGGLVADTVNTARDTALIQFSCAYFIHDLFIYVGIFAPQERLFAMHHVGVLVYMLTTLYLGYGNITAVLAITMGEVTSPIQNVWFLLKHMRYKNRLADQAFAYISWMYSAFYIFIRSGVGLYMVLYNAYSVLHAKRFPDAARKFLVFILCGGCAASQLWCYKISFRLWSKYRPAYGKVPGRSRAPSAAGEASLASNGKVDGGTNGGAAGSVRLAEGLVDRQVNGAATKLE